MLQINWQVFAIVLSLILLFSFGFLIGMLFASKFNLYLKITKKEDYEEKIAALETMLEQIQHPEEEKINYNPGEMFPPGVSPEFGLPRKLK